MFRRIWLGSVLLVSGLLAACDVANDREPSTPPSGQNGVSDEEYLVVICTGLDEFSTALVRATGPEDIGEVVEDYIASLEDVEPPADVRPFHDSFITYLTESLDDPAQLVSRPPPLPDDDVRERLASVESDVAECQDMVFFANRQEGITR